MARSRSRNTRRNTRGGGIPAWLLVLIGLVVGVGGMWYVFQHGYMPVSRNDRDVPQAAQTTGKDDAAIAQQPAQATAQAGKPEPKYDFYTILPEKEVVIPDAKLSATAAAERKKKAQQQAQAQAQAEAQAAAEAQQTATTTPADATDAGTDVAGTETSTPPVEPEEQQQQASEVAQQTPPPPPKPEPKPTSSGGSGYVLQVGSFPARSDAEALKARLALQGFRARIQAVKVNGKTWNRVRIGPYNSASKLESAKQRLSGIGIRAIALKQR